MRKIVGFLALIFGLIYLVYSSIFFLIFPIGLLAPSIIGGSAWGYFPFLIYSGYASGVFSTIFGAVMIFFGQSEKRKDLSIGSLFVLIQGLLIVFFAYSIASFSAEPGAKEIVSFFYSMIGSVVFGIVGFILLGIGINRLGTDEENSLIKIGGLLVIIGAFILPLGAIGLVLAGIGLLVK